MLATQFKKPHIFKRVNNSSIKKHLIYLKNFLVFQVSKIYSINIGGLDQLVYSMQFNIEKPETYTKII